MLEYRQNVAFMPAANRQYWPQYQQNTQQQQYPHQTSQQQQQQQQHQNNSYYSSYTPHYQLQQQQYQQQLNQKHYSYSTDYYNSYNQNTTAYAAAKTQQYHDRNYQCKANLSLKFNNSPSSSTVYNSPQNVFKEPVYGDYIGQLQYPVSKQTKRSIEDSFNQDINPKRQCTTVQNANYDGYSNNNQQKKLYRSASMIEEAAFTGQPAYQQNPYYDNFQPTLQNSYNIPYQQESSYYNNQQQDYTTENVTKKLYRSASMVEKQVNNPVTPPPAAKLSTEKEEPLTTIEIEVNEVMNSLLSIFNSIDNATSTYPFDESKLTADNGDGGIFPYHVISSIFKITVENNLF